MDLVSRLSLLGSLCLLCGSLTLPTTAPVFGLSGAYVYTSLTRTADKASGPTGGALGADEKSDSTPHGVALEGSWRRPAPDGLGAGTPALEITGGVLEANTHTEAQTHDAPGQPLVQATGNGRHETFWGLVRLPFGPRSSIEAAVEVPFHRTRDFVSADGSNLHLDPERRDLYGYTTSLALGLRRRGDDWETAAAVKYAYAFTKNETARILSDGDGPIWGAEISVSRRFPALAGSLAGGWQRGHLAIEERLPSDAVASFRRGDVQRAFARLDARGRLGAVTLSGGAAWIYTSAPHWDSGAVLNVETALRDAGLGFATRSNELVATLAADVPVRPLVSFRLEGLLRRGFERVSLFPGVAGTSSVFLDVSRDGFGVTAGLVATLP
jgi:hypothetical protein